MLPYSNSLKRKGKRKKTVTLREALVEALENLPKKKRRQWSKELCLVPTFLFAGILKKEKDSLKVIIPIGKSLSFFVKLDCVNLWLSEYTRFLAKVCNLLLSKISDKFFEPRISLQPGGRVIFEYSIVKGDKVKQRIKELILSYVMGKEKIRNIEEAEKSPLFKEISNHLVEKGYIKEDFLPKDFPLPLLPKIEEEIERVLKKNKAICAFCGKEFERIRKDNIYCSAACKTAAYRKRRKEANHGHTN